MTPPSIGISHQLTVYLLRQKFTVVAKLQPVLLRLKGLPSNLL
ncbi:MAG: hypothetical protein ACK40X_03510 [Armatimonadota bacterium]